MDKTNFSFIYVQYFPKYGYVCVNQSDDINKNTSFLKDLDLSEHEIWAVVPVQNTLADDFENRIHGYLGPYHIGGFGWFRGCTKEIVKEAVENTVWFFNTVQKIDTNLDLSRMNKPKEEIWYFPWTEQITKWPFGVVPKYPELWNLYNQNVYKRKTGSEKGRPKSPQVIE